MFSGDLAVLNINYYLVVFDGLDCALQRLSALGHHGVTDLTAGHPPREVGCGITVGHVSNELKIQRIQRPALLLRGDLSCVQLENSLVFVSMRSPSKCIFATIWQHCYLTWTVSYHQIHESKKDLLVRYPYFGSINKILGLWSGAKDSEQDWCSQV